MDKPSEPLAKATTHDYTVENIQKLAEEMLNDPDLGCRSRVVSAVSADERNPGGKQPDATTVPDQMRYDFDYIIMSI